MIRKLVAVCCLVTILFASPAFAYKRDAPAEDDSASESSEPPATSWPVEGQEDEGPPKLPGNGTRIGGYILIFTGGLAAIAGSTIIATTHHNTLGICLDAGGAVMGLGGSLMLMLGSSGYAVGPRIDPARKSYGLAVAANF